ncbi:glycosyltransferase family 2 protein [Azospira inquinata]|uniref:Glycosyltransferase family 2 protein n=1 Tax=Azospira inquinata TaxID=2785627 RepID=A0A975SKG5_9RHOO|nr:glycosyltransferase family 2 protein [Azospira inquinata]QWT46759.1 glycosyltransferase family 2 protein [Azospira inquinata]QWT47918.1 glycosyltransferase family 2 protein [Azospira inquinata]
MIQEDKECWLSVVVTAYNVEAWIPRCLDSLLQGWLPGVEIIVVDDGSTDGTAAQVRQYEHQALRPYLLPRNGGVSAARNFAIQQARGTYLAFVDGDDTVAPSYYEAIQAALQATPAQFYSFEAFNFFPDGREATPVVGLDRSFQGKGAELLELMHRCHVHSFHCWRVVVEREVLLAKGWLFPEELSVFEDMAWFLMTCLGAVSACHVPAPIYRYWHRSNSVINQSTEQSRLGRVHAVAGCIQRLKLMQSEVTEKRVKQILGNLGCHLCFSAFHQMKRIASIEMKTRARCALWKSGAAGFLLHNGGYLKLREQVRAYKRALQLCLAVVTSCRSMREK